MMVMQFPHMRGLDLSLVEPLYVLLDERHVTRAANRCGMSQSAMSRALERLRSALSDELLIRSHGAYERTPRGDQLLSDLQDLLPRLDAAVCGNRFDATTSTQRFCIATTDYAAAIVIPKLLVHVARLAPNVRIDVVAWNDKVFDELEAGRIQVALIGAQPAGSSFESELLFTDEFVCVVAENHPLCVARLALKRYVEYEHAVVAVRDGGQPLIERALKANGLKRRVGYRSPYQLSAMVAASSSTMICTTARRLATQLAPAVSVRLLQAPRELPRIVYNMSWHRRLRDDAAQNWLRMQLRIIGKEL